MESFEPFPFILVPTVNSFLKEIQGFQEITIFQSSWNNCHNIPIESRRNISMSDIEVRRTLSSSRSSWGYSRIVPKAKTKTRQSCPRGMRFSAGEISVQEISEACIFIPLIEHWPPVLSLGARTTRDEYKDEENMYTDIYTRLGIIVWEEEGRRDSEFPYGSCTKIKRWSLEDDTENNVHVRAEAKA